MTTPEKKQSYYAHITGPDGVERRVSDFLAILKDPARGYPKGWEPEKVLPILQSLGTGMDKDGVALTPSDKELLPKLIKEYSQFEAERKGREAAVAARAAAVRGPVQRIMYRE